MSERFCICGKPLVHRAKEAEATFQKRKSCSFACILPTLQAERRAAVWEHAQKTDDCWLWTGAQAHWRGYGRYGKQLAHRYMWELSNGPINPSSLCVLHRCDNPRCVNPDHLFLGTRTDNHKDMMVKGRNKPVKGEDNKNSKLKDSDVVEIARLLTAGVEQPVIAERFGVSQSLISNINVGKNWKHILNGANITTSQEAVHTKFWNRTEPEPMSGCLLWVGGATFVFSGKPLLARRVAWQITYGAIPERMFVLHKCGNPFCVNPQHLALSEPSKMKSNYAGYRAASGHSEILGNTVLDADKVREIRQRWQECGGVLGKGYQETRTITQGALAKEYGVNRVVISAILLGKSWKHVE